MSKPLQLTELRRAVLVTSNGTRAEYVERIDEGPTCRHSWRRSLEVLRASDPCPFPVLRGEERS